MKNHIKNTHDDINNPVALQSLLKTHFLLPSLLLAGCYTPGWAFLHTLCLITTDSMHFSLHTWTDSLATQLQSGCCYIEWCAGKLSFNLAALLIWPTLASSSTHGFTVSCKHVSDWLSHCSLVLCSSKTTHLLHMLLIFAHAGLGMFSLF